MKVSDYVAEFLRAQGVDCVFEVIGGMVTHLVDSIHRRGTVQLISMHHEQAAAFAADAAARLTGIPGVAMATSGPGATNLLTGIGSCYYDSTPAVFVTGQVNRHELKGPRQVRQLGFQETDIVSMARPITKLALQVGSPDDVPVVLETAFRTALSGRPGPVLLDLPMDIQSSQIPARDPALVLRESSTLPDTNLVQRILSHLARASRPLVLAGGGVNVAGARALLRQFADKAGIPVVNSLMAADVLPFGSPWRVGMIGTYGNRWANLALGRCDVLLVLGSRLDIRQTGADTDAFRRGRAIYHVDCDESEINNRVLGSTPILSDVGAFLEAAIKTLPGRPETKGGSAWLEEIKELRDSVPDTSELGAVSGINPNWFMHELGRASPMAVAFVVDVGSHQMWAAQSLELHAEQRFVTSGGMGAMGFALPATIGAAFAHAGHPIVTISGDGGFQMNSQELETVTHHRLPLKIVVVDNGCYGMVRQFQESYFDKRYPSTYWGYSAPDFVAIAQAYGIEARRVGSSSEVEEGLSAMWADPLAPFLLHVSIDTFTNVYPKIAFGRPMTEMEPLAEPIQMERS